MEATQQTECLGEGSVNAILFRCAFCDQLFYTLDGLIPVDGTSYYGSRRLYFANNRKLIHDLYEVTDERTEERNPRL